MDSLIRVGQLPVKDVIRFIESSPLEEMHKRTTKEKTRVTTHEWVVGPNGKKVV